MPIARRIINRNRDEAPFLLCCWDECDADGVDLHAARVNYGTRQMPYVVTYVFCSDGHKMLWVHAHRDLGNRPPGYRLSSPWR